MATLAWLQAAGGTAGQMFNLPPDQIHIEDGFNIRTETPELSEAIGVIAESIFTIGFKRTEPLIVRHNPDKAKGGVLVTEGHKRIRATRIAIERGREILSLPCLLEPPGISPAERALLMLKSAEKAPFAPLEIAEAFVRMRDDGWNNAAIAKNMTRDVGWVADIFALRAAPLPTREMVKAGDVAFSTARKVLRQEGAKEATAHLQRAKEKATERGSKKVTAKDIEASRTVQPLPKPPISITPYAVRVAEVWSEQTEEFRASMPDEFRLVLDALRGRVR